MKNFETKCVHSGKIKTPFRSINTPIFQTSTFILNDKDYEKIKEKRTREINIYTRYGNPTRSSVETKIADLEDAEDAISFSSGMGAISSTLFTFLEPGETILTTIDLYGGTYSFIKEHLKKWGIEYITVPPENTGEITRNTKKSRILYFESLSNPLLKMVDIEKIAESKTEEQILIIDNTFLTPYNFNPLNHGADIVVHSATKYLNGHSDLTGGFCCGKKEMMDRVWNEMLNLGASMEPISAFLLNRGMKTLSVRMERHNSNAKEIAEFLEDHNEIKKVFSPYIETYPQKDLREKYLHRGAGGMVSFVLKGGNERGVKFMHSLEVIKEATSLGGVESLVSMPFNTSQRNMSKKEKSKIGIKSGTVRLSVGIEDAGDLIRDIDKALEKSRG